MCHRTQDWTKWAPDDIRLFCRLVPLHSLNHQHARPSVLPAATNIWSELKSSVGRLSFIILFAVLPLLYCKVTSRVPADCAPAEVGSWGRGTWLDDRCKRRWWWGQFALKRKVGYSWARRRWEGGSGVQCGVLGRRRKPLLIVQLMMTTTETDPQCTDDDCLY